MTDVEAIKARHSVRKYLKKPLEEYKIMALQKLIDDCNNEGDLNIQLILNEPKCFTKSLLAYGMFSGVTNYIAMIGKDSDSLYEKIGYYGEKIVLYAQQLNLNTCWVGGTFKKSVCPAQVNEDEKLVLVIVIGYGANKGKPHKSKDVTEIADLVNTPKWFVDGIEMVMLAPTALNRQNFKFSYRDGLVIAKSNKEGFTNVDIGIAKLHFEIGSKKSKDIWV